jgi:Ca2+-binding EF-hand superfamily protein
MGFSEDEIKEYQELYEAFSQDKDGNDRGTLRHKINPPTSCHLLVVVFSHCYSLGYIEAKDFREYVRMIGGNPSEKKLDEWVKKVCARLVIIYLYSAMRTISNRAFLL